MPTLRSQLDALAANFATQIIAVLQGASLHELVGSEGGGWGSSGRKARAVPGGGGHPSAFGSVIVAVDRPNDGPVDRAGGGSYSQTVCGMTTVMGAFGHVELVHPYGTTNLRPVLSLAYLARPDGLRPMITPGSAPSSARIA